MTPVFTRTNRSISPRLWVPAVIAAALLGWWLWPAAETTAGQSAQEQSPARGALGGAPAIPVLVAAASRSDLHIVQTGLGTVTPTAMVTVRARVSGQLERVLFEEGQEVKQGDLLAEIDPRPFRAELAQVKGQAERNRALLANALQDLERYQSLHPQNSISQQQIDAQKSLVEQYRGTVVADEGAVEQAQLQVDFTRITAPISGRVGLRQVDAGNNIGPDDNLAVIASLHPVDVVFTIPEDTAPRLQTQFYKAREQQRGLAVEAWDRANRAQIAAGELFAIDNRIDSSTGTIKLKARFDNRDGRLFPNQFVNVRVRVETLAGVVLVPGAALQRGSEGTFVYVVSSAENSPAGQTVTVRNVNPGPRENDLVAIEQGLQPGELVVINGTDWLREGARVTIATPDATLPGQSPPAAVDRPLANR